MKKILFLVTGLVLIASLSWAGGCPPPQQFLSIIESEEPLPPESGSESVYFKYDISSIDQDGNPSEWSSKGRSVVGSEIFHMSRDSDEEVEGFIFSISEINGNEIHGTFVYHNSRFLNCIEDEREVVLEVGKTFRAYYDDRRAYVFLTCFLNPPSAEDQINESLSMMSSSSCVTTSLHVNNPTQSRPHGTDVNLYSQHYTTLYNRCSHTVPVGVQYEFRVAWPLPEVKKSNSGSFFLPPNSTTTNNTPSKAWLYNMRKTGNFSTLAKTEVSMGFTTIGEAYDSGALFVIP